jgi:3-methylcrotonyl-CoA carboxylase alpha subunit
MSITRFNKILIANRGEIACRIIQTARRLGIRTVAVYSDADINALHVSMADEAVYIGAAPSRESYLDFHRVLQAAKDTAAEAIHPGYGFLSENADFCRACKENNIVFIGPPVEAIEAMGSKSAAKNIMQQANVPLVPGYHGSDQSPERLKKSANAMGYPVLLKAVAGGGGKGMRQVWSEDEFDEALLTAKREAMNAFANDDMLVEKYLTQPRHIEIQVFCDQHNNAVYLFERDCSVQRRHQKVIEEAPAPGMTAKLREQMGEAAICSAQAINYQGAGTVEFLLDEDGAFYFMEMNTRLQVEHPITEMITGQDLVEWQLSVAAGEILPLKQEQLSINGHAFEARIYAEDPANDFLPASGKLSFLQTPKTSQYVRIDTGVRQGDEVSVFYDPMISKLIVWDKDRDKALQRLTKALSEYYINGITTNIDFLHRLASCEAFKKADIDTRFIEKNYDEIFYSKTNDKKNTKGETYYLAALYCLLEQAQNSAGNSIHSNDPNSPWHSGDAWRLNESNNHRLTLNINDQVIDITAEQLSSKQPSTSSSRFAITINEKTLLAQGALTSNTLNAEIDGHQLRVTIADNNGDFQLFTDSSAIRFNRVLPDLGEANDTGHAGGLTAPMNGTMVALLVETGSVVKKGDALVVMEAMKMEHTIRAPQNGTVIEFYFQPGNLVDGGAELLNFTAEEKPEQKLKP